MMNVGGSWRTTDFETLPVQKIDAIASHGVVGKVALITFVTKQIGITDDAMMKVESVIGERLTFDLKMARELRDALDEQISFLTALDVSAT